MSLKRALHHSIDACKLCRMQQVRKHSRFLGSNGHIFACVPPTILKLSSRVHTHRQASHDAGSHTGGPPHASPHAISRSCSSFCHAGINSKNLYRVAVYAGHVEFPPMYVHSCLKVVICCGHLQVLHFDGSKIVMATEFGGNRLPHPARSERARNVLGEVRRALPAMETEGAGKSTFCGFMKAKPSKPDKDWSCRLSVRAKALPMHRNPEKLNMLVRPVRFALREPPSTLRDCSES